LLGTLVDPGRRGPPARYLHPDPGHAAPCAAYDLRETRSTGTSSPARPGPGQARQLTSPTRRGSPVKRPHVTSAFHNRTNQSCLIGYSACRYSDLSTFRFLQHLCKPVMPTYASTRQASGMTSTRPMAPEHSACWSTTKGGLTMPKIKLSTPKPEIYNAHSGLSRPGRCSGHSIHVYSCRVLLYLC
jgi:hypothetical protein